MEPTGSTARDRKGGLSAFAFEVLIALALGIWGTIVMMDSRRMGAGWADGAPESGFFSFYIGLILTVAAVFALWRAWRHRPDLLRTAVTGREFRLVLSVFIPTVVLVAAVGWLGIYAASALYLLWFMLTLGRFGWAKGLLVSVLFTAALFAVFELWFRIPLPKGPLETMLGF